MRAVIFRKHDGTEALDQAYVPVPQPGAHEVLVRVYAAGSGIGSAAIQIAKLMGCRVITTVGGAEKAAGHGADVIFEHIGGNTFTKSVTCLNKKGRLLTCGATAGRNVTLDLRYLYSKQLSVIGSYMGGLAELKRIIRRMEDEGLRPVADRIYPLAQTKQAFQRMVRRENFGKIIKP